MASRLNRERLPELAGRRRNHTADRRPMHDPTEFAKLRVDHDAGTIVWPNEADFAPETLYLLPDERDKAA